MKNNSVKWQSFKNGQTPNMGIREATVWFSFALMNNSERNEWILHVDYRTLDDVSLFIFDSAGTLLLSGSQGILTRNIHHQRMPVFPLFLEKNKSITVYLRVQTSSLLIFPVKISTPLAFSESENAQRNVYLPALGILLAMLLINILLLFTSREKAFLFLSLSIAAEICFIATVVGLFYEYVQFNPAIILQKLRFIFIGLAYGFHILFAVYYLNLKNHNKLLRAEVTAIIGFFAFALLAGTGMINAHISGTFLVPVNILFFLIQFTIAGYLSLKKAPMSCYYLFSFSPIILAMLLYIAVYNSWIGANLFFSNSGLYASALFAIFLTSGLTEKMINVKHATARADRLEVDKIALNAEIMRRQEVEKHLKESELRFHHLFELSPLPILLSEFESGKIVDLNIALTDFTGLSKADILGNTIFGLGFTDRKKRDELSRILSEKEHVLAYETTLSVNGDQRIIHFFMSVLHINQGRFIITVISDITNQKDVEARLKELNLTKDKFFSIIAHDLVNPFHAMILYSKELKVYTAGNERAAAYNNNLLTTAQNTYNLLQNLLTWARAQTRQISFNPHAVNLGDLLADTVSDALSIAKSKQIDIINEAGREILIEADVQMITLVLRNLISNSIKFSFNQGVIKISSHEDEHHITISVSDKGTGMDADETAKLFDLFKTAQCPGTAGETGTGLGLVICHEFVNYHGGSIKVESQPGRGSTFNITLPKKQQ